MILPGVEPADFAARWGCTEADAPSVMRRIRDTVPSGLGLVDGGVCATEHRLAFAPALCRSRPIRSYDELRYDEIGCTVDVASWDGDVGVVLDYKTGRQAGLEPAASNAQLLTYATALAQAHDLCSVSVGLVLVGDDGVCRVDMSPNALDWFDFDAHCAALTAAIGAAKAGAQPTPGTWCRDKYCPALGVCPAAAHAADGLVPAVRSAQLVTADDAYRLHVAIGLAEDYAERALSSAKAALHSYLAEHGPVETPEGELRLVDTERRTIKPLSADGLDVLKGAFGANPIALSTAVEVRATTDFARLKRAVALVAGRGERADMQRQIEERLADAGLVSVGVYPRVVMRKRRAGSAAEQGDGE
jgi:hypothetical protein